MNHLIHSTLDFYCVPGTGDTTVNKTDRSKSLFYSVSANTIGGMEFKLCVLDFFFFTFIYLFIYGCVGSSFL